MATARPDEVKEAVALLERFESCDDAEESIEAFNEGIDALDEYLESNPNSPHAEYISNIKQAHTRRLLVRIRSLGQLEFDGWFKLLVPLLVRVSSEVSQLASEDPELAATFAGFKAEYAETLRSMLQKDR